MFSRVEIACRCRPMSRPLFFSLSARLTPYLLPNGCDKETAEIARTFHANTSYKSLRHRDNVCNKAPVGWTYTEKEKDRRKEGEKRTEVSQFPCDKSTIQKAPRSRTVRSPTDNETANESVIHDSVFFVFDASSFSPRVGVMLISVRTCVHLVSPVVDRVVRKICEGGER